MKHKLLREPLHSYNLYAEPSYFARVFFILSFRSESSGACSPVMLFLTGRSFSHQPYWCLQIKRQSLNAHYKRHKWMDKNLYVLKI